MQSVGLIPRSRLKWIPDDLKFAHEVAFFLHDEMTRMLVECEAGEGDVVEVKFRSRAQADKFEAEDEATDILASFGLERPLSQAASIP
jgi:hypothetical protein